MIYIVALLILVISLVPSIPTQAQEQNHWLQKLAPTTMMVQYAGNLGFVSTGVGKTFKADKVSTYLIYGYLPKSVNGVEVKTVACKLTTQIKRYEWKKRIFSTYAGLTLMRCYTKYAYMSFPDYFPKGYYDVPQAIHAAPLIGELYTWSTGEKEKNKWSAFVEFSTLDYYLIDYVRNLSTMAFTDLWTLSFGLIHLF